MKEVISGQIIQPAYGGWKGSMGQMTSSSFGGWRKPLGCYLIGADEKISDWVVKTTCPGDMETSMKLVVWPSKTDSI